MMRALLLALLLASCDDDSLLQRRPSEVSQVITLRNASDEAVGWWFTGTRGPWGFSTAPGEAQVVRLLCLEGERLCWMTTPEHAFAERCVSCGMGAAEETAR
jgi:hypothetical protein